MFYLKENNVPLSALVFDLGNVLIDYDPARFMFNLGIPQEKIPRLVEITDGREEWGEYDRGVLTSADIAALAIRDEPLLRKEITYYLKHRDEQFSALTWNVSLLYRAKEAGLKVYLLSNCPEDSFAYFSRHFIFLQDLDGVVISGAIKINKPDPAIFEYLLKTYPEIDPKHTLFIDDRKPNAEAGAKAGLQALNIPKNAVIEDYLTITED